MCVCVCVYICVLLCKHAEDCLHLCLASFFCEVQRRLFVPCERDLRAPVEKELYDFIKAALARLMKRGVPPKIFGIDVCASMDEEFDHGQIPRARGPVQPVAPVLFSFQLIFFLFFRSSLRTPSISLLNA